MRRCAVPLTLALAAIVGLASLLAVWVDRQALNAENWSNTSTALLENATIRKQLSIYVVDQLDRYVGLEGKLESALPDFLDPVAGSAANRISGTAERTAEAALKSDAVLGAWRFANRVAMQQLVNVVDGEQDGLIVATPGAIVLNVRPIIEAVAGELRLPGSAVARIPGEAARFTVLKSTRVSTIQRYGQTLRTAALVLPLLFGLLLVLALWLSKGRRRTLQTVGCVVAAVGLAILAIRLVATGQAADALTHDAAVKPAVSAALSIATRMIADIGLALVLIGFTITLAAVLAGRPRPVRKAIPR